MSKKINMQNPAYLSLLEEWEKVQKIARKDPTRKGTVVSISLDKFDPEEILNPPDEVRLHIAYKNVLFKSYGNPPHDRGQGNTNICLANFFQIRYGMENITPVTDASLAVRNVNECHTKFIKKPDGGVRINCSNRVYPPVVVEVGSTNDDLDMLLREAEVYLNQYTEIEYVLLLNIEFSANQIDNLRFVLCRRLPISQLQILQAEFAKDQEKFAKKLAKLRIKQGTCESRLGGRRKSEDELKEMDAHQIQQVYQVEIINDYFVTRETIRDLAFLFEDEPIIRGTALENLFNGHFLVVITARRLLDIFEAPLQ